MSQESGNISSFKWTARIVGILFIIGTAAGILSVVFTGAIQGSPDQAYFNNIASQDGQILIGVLLVLIMAAACAGTAIWMYPVLKQYSEVLAIGAVGFRLIEGVLMVVVGTGLLLILRLSQEFVRAGSPDASFYPALGTLLLAGREWVADVPMLLAWCLAALMYYYIFYRTRLVPRWLSVWGLLGITLMMAACMLVQFGYINSSMSIHTLLSVPIALQEMVFAAWLIVKGFDMSGPVRAGSVARTMSTADQEA